MTKEQMDHVWVQIYEIDYFLKNHVWPKPEEVKNEMSAYKPERQAGLSKPDREGA